MDVQRDSCAIASAARFIHLPLELRVHGEDGGGGGGGCCDAAGTR